MDTLVAVILIAVIVGWLLVLGFSWGLVHAGDDIENQREQLAAEWRAMERERQINSIYMDTRQRLKQAEGDVGRRPPTVVEGEWK